MFETISQLTAAEISRMHVDVLRLQKVILFTRQEKDAFELIKGKMVDYDRLKETSILMTVLGVALTKDEVGVGMLFRRATTNLEHLRTKYSLPKEEPVSQDDATEAETGQEAAQNGL